MWLNGIIAIKLLVVIVSLIGKCLFSFSLLQGFVLLLLIPLFNFPCFSWYNCDFVGYFVYFLTLCYASLQDHYSHIFVLIFLLSSLVYFSFWVYEIHCCFCLYLWTRNKNSQHSPEADQSIFLNTCQSWHSNLSSESYVDFDLDMSFSLWLYKTRGLFSRP